MRIKSKIRSFDYIEEVSKELMQDDTIWLPHNISDSAIGFEASFIQLLITWKRAHSQPKIYTYIKEEGSKNTLKVPLKLYALIAFYLVDDIYFYGKEKKKIERKTILSYYQNMVDTMNQPHKPKANHINTKLVSIQGAKAEYIRTLFDSHGRTSENLITRTSFERLTKKIISTNKSLFEKIDNQRQYITNISHILYETLLNTIEHGYTDMNDIDYDRNVRGVIFKEHAFSEYKSLDYLMESSQENSAFEQYLLYCKNKFEEGHAANHQQHLERVKIRDFDEGKQTESYSFLELSVFDGGCGIARRLSGRENLSQEEEREYCVKAFEKHISSKNTSGFGIGLNGVWNTLIDLKALIRLRTGRISLYQVFPDAEKNNPDVEKNNPDIEKNKPSFQDWKTEGDLQRMEGSILTILIPIFNKTSE